MSCDDDGIKTYVAIQKNAASLPKNFEYTRFLYFDARGIFDKNFHLNKMVACGTRQGSLIILGTHKNIDELNYVCLLSGHQYEITDLLLSKDSSSFLSISSDATICCWSTRDASCLISQKIPNMSTGNYRIIHSQNSPGIVWIWKYGEAVYVYDLLTNIIINYKEFHGLNSFHVIHDRNLAVCAGIGQIQTFKYQIIMKFNTNCNENTTNTRNNNYIEDKNIYRNIYSTKIKNHASLEDNTSNNNNSKNNNLDISTNLNSSTGSFNNKNNNKNNNKSNSNFNSGNNESQYIYEFMDKNSFNYDYFFFQINRVCQFGVVRVVKNHWTLISYLTGRNIIECDLPNMDEDDRVSQIEITGSTSFCLGTIKARYYLVEVKEKFNVRKKAVNEEDKSLRVSVIRLIGSEITNQKLHGAFIVNRKIGILFSSNGNNIVLYTPLVHKPASIISTQRRGSLPFNAESPKSHKTIPKNGNLVNINSLNNTNLETGGKKFENDPEIETNTDTKESSKEIVNHSEIPKSPHNHIPTNNKSNVNRSFLKHNHKTKILVAKKDKPDCLDINQLFHKKYLNFCDCQISAVTFGRVIKTMAIIGFEDGKIIFSNVFTDIHPIVSYAMSDTIIDFAQNKYNNYIIAIGKNGSACIFRDVNFLVLFETPMIPIISVYYILSTNIFILEFINGCKCFYSPTESQPYASQLFIPKDAEKIWPNVFVEDTTKPIHNLSVKIKDFAMKYDIINFQKLYLNAEKNDSDEHVKLLNSYCHKLMNSIQNNKYVDKSFDDQSDKIVLIGDSLIPTFFYSPFNLNPNSLHNCSFFIGSKLLIIFHIVHDTILKHNNSIASDTLNNENDEIHENIENNPENGDDTNNNQNHSMHNINGEIYNKCSQIIENDDKLDYSQFGEFLPFLMKILFYSSNPFIRSVALRLCIYIGKSLKTENCNEIMNSMMKSKPIEDTSKMVTSILLTVFESPIQSNLKEELISFLISKIKDSLVNQEITTLAIYILEKGVKNKWFQLDSQNFIHFVQSTSKKEKESKEINKKLVKICVSNLSLFFSSFQQLINNNQNDKSVIKCIFRIYDYAAVKILKKNIGCLVLECYAKASHSLNSNNSSLIKLYQKSVGNLAAVFTNVYVENDVIILAHSDGFLKAYQNGKLLFNDKIFDLSENEQAEVNLISVGPEMKFGVVISSRKEVAKVFYLKEPTRRLFHTTRQRVLNEIKVAKIESESKYEVIWNGINNCDINVINK
ncbi:hypothetical protein TRFO_42844 [Tritrichomonas foetus]|uniref:Uncharacterized protein n=1 Tax=Tritrichomonas foetus TaxID=1144522 RepID=A0A1J4KUC9_9EUKA|nr:hypothetical protein TRFO_42844 [Tritrichomonas foetus]|eukprot:OHT14875.1 hypothetical protein TRFO_42844 [Tritrichomonas foetus]